MRGHLYDSPPPHIFSFKLSSPLTSSSIFFFSSFDLANERKRGKSKHYPFFVSFLSLLQLRSDRVALLCTEHRPQKNVNVPVAQNKVLVHSLFPTQRINSIEHLREHTHSQKQRDRDRKRERHSQGWHRCSNLIRRCEAENRRLNLFIFLASTFAREASRSLSAFSSNLSYLAKRDEDSLIEPLAIGQLDS